MPFSQCYLFAKRFTPVGCCRSFIYFQTSIAEAKSESLAEARSARRRRKLNQIEIPEDHVIVTDELLGKGGFGEVFLADLNGRNAAAKVPTCR